jgi:chemotaxis signal transduction protein
MVEKMGIGALIDVEKFIDPQFAEAACKNAKGSRLPSTLHDTTAEVMEILRRAAPRGGKTKKAMLSMEGKYLVFALGKQGFGIEISKIREIIGRLPIRTMPQTPPFVKGVINLRDKVIPIMDLRLRFGMEEVVATERSCIIVLEHIAEGAVINIGVAVDSVTEVLEIKTSEIADTPFFGAGIDTTYILAMAKTESGVKILLDMDRLL